MMLAGIPVSDRLVLTLAAKLRDAGFHDTAVQLENAYDRETKIVELTVPAREQILRVLEGAPDQLATLRADLLKEHEWSTRGDTGDIVC